MTVLPSRSFVDARRTRYAESVNEAAVGGS
jgi:hypothetical protein